MVFFGSCPYLFRRRYACDKRNIEKVDVVITRYSRAYARGARKVDLVKWEEAGLIERLKF